MVEYAADISNSKLEEQISIELLKRGPLSESQLLLDVYGQNCSNVGNLKNSLRQMRKQGLVGIKNEEPFYDVEEGYDKIYKYNLGRPLFGRNVGGLSRFLRKVFVY